MSNTLWWFICAQAFMGLVDILVHHELTQRLAWRVEAAAELRLHGARNLLYSVVYLLLGWTQPGGAWAWFIIGVLALETLLTFWDWLEEDASRSPLGMQPLPASERCLHGLLTINYGVILALLLPLLLHWSQQPTALAVLYQGPWSLLAGAFAVFAVLFGMKDLDAAARLNRWRSRQQAGLETLAVELGEPNVGPSDVLVTGGTGLVGSRLVPALIAAGHRVTVLTRRPQIAARLGTPLTLIDSLDQLSDDTSVDVVIHLAGEPIAGGLWTERRKNYLRESRRMLIEDLGALLARLQQAPRVWVNASAIGWYGVETHDSAISAASDSSDLDENSGHNGGFAHELCELIEASARTACDRRTAVNSNQLATRLVNLRIGLVLAAEDGYLGQLLPSIDLGVGAILGDGQHWQSWIHRDDLIRVIWRCAHDAKLEGPVNATAPRPARFEQLVRTLAKKIGRRILFRVPAAPLRLLPGGFADEILLADQRVLPEQLQKAGFEFLYADVDAALAAVLE